MQMQDRIQLTEKLCSKCKKTKSVKDFRIKYQKTVTWKQENIIVNYYDSHCIKCRNTTAHEKYSYELARDRWLRCGYGITLEQYDSMSKSQNGVCAACGNPAMRRPGRTQRTKNIVPPLHVDHDHATGKIRGLLCDECNTALGSLHDNPERIKALLQYIISWL